MKNQDHQERMRHMLRELSSMAEEATLTGALRDGEADAIRRYNAILEWTSREDIVPNGLFQPLEATASWATIGVESRLLSSYLSPDKRDKRHGHGCGTGEAGAFDDPGILVAMAPFMDSADLAKLVESCLEKTNQFDPGILVALAPFIGSDMIGRITRRFWTPNGSKEPTPEPTPEPAAPKAPPEPEPTLQSTSSREQLEAILAALRDPTLPPEQRAEIALRLAQSVAS